MKYLLMHKNIPVALFSLDETETAPKPKQVMLNPNAKEHLPLGAQMNNMKFIEWWKDRAIPKTRQGAVLALEKLGYPSTVSAMINNLCLSLNDCYWIKPEGTDFTWEQVNLFSNPFTDTFGELTFNSDHGIDLRNHTNFLRSVSSQGEVQKKWCIAEDGRRFLVKGNYGTSYQQSLNEVFATQLHEKQSWKNFTPYYLTQISIENGLEGIGCFSYNFCTEDIESVSAWEVLQTIKFKSNESLFEPFRNLCLEHGIKAEDFDIFMDYQLMSDFLLSNTDRHMNNIAILRNANTLQWIGMAPIYDTGNSMYFRTPISEFSKIELGQDKVHSFITSKEVNLLKYVKDRKFFDLSKVDPDFSIYEKDVDERKSRVSYLQNVFERKFRMLESFQHGKDIYSTKPISLSGYGYVFGQKQEGLQKTEKHSDKTDDYDPRTDD